jgi:hypothetical protein
MKAYGHNRRDKLECRHIVDKANRKSARQFAVKFIGECIE